LALGGCRFIKINNNQMEDGVDMKGCVGEEARLGPNMWGGWLPVFWGGILMLEEEVPNELKVLLTLSGTLTSLLNTPLRSCPRLP
jgi:hypothetical protein